MTIALILLILGVTLVVICAERFVDNDADPADPAEHTDAELVDYWTTFKDPLKPLPPKP